jgi:hypothetical protein
MLALGLLTLAAAARAADDARIEELERRIAQLEGRAEIAEERARAAEGRSGYADAAERLVIGGSANVGYFDGQSYGATADAGARVWDARLFLDAELGEDVRAGGTPLFRNIGFSFEWDLVRLGHLSNQVGELYVDLQGVGGSSWLNLRPGRFQIPVGENYKRFSKGYSSNPFISNTLGGPWWWDEGLEVYGQSDGDTFGYVASLTNGETPLDFDDGDGEQLSLKLWMQPAKWLYASVSGLHSGEIGTGLGALWLGETVAQPIGNWSAAPVLVDGVVVPATTARIDSTWLAGGDLVLTPFDNVRLWLGGGHYDIASRAGSLYDRALHYWIAELLLQGALLSPGLAPGYAGLRADGLGTNDGGRGYLLDPSYAGDLGYNMHAFNAYTAVLGWRLGAGATLRAEYSLRDIDLVRGVSDEMREDARGVDTFAVELGVRF